MHEYNPPRVSRLKFSTVLQWNTHRRYWCVFLSSWFYDFRAIIELTKRMDALIINAAHIGWKIKWWLLLWISFLCYFLLLCTFHYIVSFLFFQILLLVRLGVWNVVGGFETFFILWWGVEQENNKKGKASLYYYKRWRVGEDKKFVGLGLIGGGEVAFHCIIWIKILKCAFCYWN